jgi:hypothetical protein
VLVRDDGDTAADDVDDTLTLTALPTTNPSR